MDSTWPYIKSELKSNWTFENMTMSKFPDETPRCNCSLKNFFKIHYKIIPSGLGPVGHQACNTLGETLDFAVVHITVAALKT